MTFAFAAAGTGGHVFPALAVAEALVAKGVARDDILFIGGHRMEATTVPEAGFPFVGLEIRGLRRSLSLDNVTLPVVVWRAAAAARREMERRRVGVAALFGGYVSVPVGAAARRLGVPFFVQEQNAVPGLANRLMARAATASFTGFPEAAERLPRASATGNPLRREVALLDAAALRPAARARYGLDPAGAVIGILGGSLGARILNETAGAIAAEVAARGLDAQLLHLTGPTHLAEVQPLAAKASLPWRTVAFETEMQYFYAATDIVVARAGASTISELAATGTPSVVVPYAAGTAGHQAANAASLAAAGGTVVVPETEVESVPRLVGELVADEERRGAMARAARSVGRPEAADVIATALLEAVGRESEAAS